MYSFGIMMWEVLTGIRPFEELHKLPAVVQMTHIAGGVRPDSSRLPHDVPVAVQIIISRCWYLTQSARPSMKEVVAELKKANFGAPK